MISTETFYVENTGCRSCTGKIRKALMQVISVHAVRVYSDQAKVCVMGVALNRYLLAGKLASLGFPEIGRNTLLKKVKAILLR